MSFSTLNGINAARQVTGGGLAGTRRAPIAAPQPQAWAPPVHSINPQAQVSGGMMGTAQQHIQGMQPMGPQQGVQVGQRGQQAQLGAPPPPLNFDPNDPANAALAGYMNGA